jgi:hypothetical protein
MADQGYARVAAEGAEEDCEAMLREDGNQPVVVEVTGFEEGAPAQGSWRRRRVALVALGVLVFAAVGMLLGLGCSDRACKKFSYAQVQAALSTQAKEIEELKEEVAEEATEVEEAQQEAGAAEKEAEEKTEEAEVAAEAADAEAEAVEEEVDMVLEEVDMVLDAAKQANMSSSPAVAPGASPPASEHRYLVLLTGIGHSGTSMAAALLFASGAFMSVNPHLKKTGEHGHHPAGIYETPRIWLLNDRIIRHHRCVTPSTCDISASNLDLALVKACAKLLAKRSAVTVVKDPRLGMTLPYWLKAAQQLEYDRVVVLLANRHPYLSCKNFQSPDNVRGDCGVNWLAVTRRTCEQTPRGDLVLFDLNDYQRDNYGVYTKMLDDLERHGVHGLRRLSAEEVDSLTSKRLDDIPEMTLGKVFHIHPLPVKVTPELLAMIDNLKSGAILNGEC